MATTISFNGTSYSIPASGERAWGSSVSSYLIAVASGALQKTGGSFTLTAADVDFGATYGLKAMKFSSRNTPSTTGVVRLGNNEGIGWRNAGNSADLLFKVNASNILEFNGNPLLTLALGAAYTALKMNAGGTAYEWGLLTNDNIDGSAAIAWSKISKTGSNLSDLTTKSHTSLTDIGTNTHAQIDTALSTAATHFANTSNPHSVTASQVGLGNVDNTSDSTKNGAVATLTNKTIVSPVIDDYMDINEEAAPGTPASGKVRVYAKTDKKLYKKDSSGVEQEVGAGSGTGLATFFSDDFENGSAANWTSYDDGASATPVDGTGGSPSTLTVTASSSSPLRGTYSLSVAKSAADGQGEGIAASVAVPSGYQQAAKRVIEFLWDGSDANYAAGDMVCYIYDVTNATLITPSVTSLPAAKVPMQIAWDSTTSGSYRLIFHVATTNATAYTVKIDDVKVAPGNVVPVPAVGIRTAYTPNAAVNQGLGTLGTTELYYKRESDTMVISGYFTTGTVGASAARLAIPDGFTIGTLTQTVVGKWTRNTSTATTNKQGTVLATTGTNYLMFSVDDYTAAINSFSAQNGSGIFANANIVGIYDVRIPIAEWAGSVNAVPPPPKEYLYNSSGTTAAGGSDTSSFAYGPVGAAIGSINSATTTASFTSMRVRSMFPIQETDDVYAEFSDANGGWFKAAELGLGYLSQGTARYGVVLDRVSGSSTDIDVLFGNAGARNTNTTYGNAGAAWSALTSVRWRVVIERGGAAYYAHVQQNASGLVERAGQLLGTNTNDSAAAGYVGEVISSRIPQSSHVTLTTSTTANVTSITVTAGDWEISGMITFDYGASASVSQIYGGISKTSATIPSADVWGSPDAGEVKTANSFAAFTIAGQRTQTLSFPAYRFSTSSTVTLYLVANSTFTVAAGYAAGFMQARRER